MGNEVEWVQITAFGRVAYGPKFLRYMVEARHEMATKPKRSKDYKYAKERLRRMDEAIATLSEIEWAAGGNLERTP